MLNRDEFLCWLGQHAVDANPRDIAELGKAMMQVQWMIKNDANNRQASAEWMLKALRAETEALGFVILARGEAYPWGLEVNAANGAWCAVPAVRAAE